MPSGTLEILALELAKALQPLKDRLRAAQVRTLFMELGLEFPASLETQNSFVSALDTAATDIRRLGEIVPRLITSVEDDVVEDIVRAAVDIIDVLRTLIPAFESIGNTLGGLSGSFPGVDPADVTAFASELPVRLLEYTLVSYLETHHQVLLRAFALFGLVDLIQVAGDPADAAKPSHTIRRLRLDRIGDFFNSPEDVLRDLYGWGDPAFDGRLLLERLYNLVSSLSVPVSYDPASIPPALKLLLLRLSPRTDLNPPGLELALEISLPAGVEASFPIFSPEWALEFAMGADLDASAGITIQPPATFNLIPPSGTLQGEISVGFARLPRPGSSTIVLVGVPGGSRLQAQRIAVSFNSIFIWDAANSRATSDFGFTGEVSGGKLVVTMENADGFLGEILAGFGIEADFDLGFGWRSGGGIFFTGSSTLEIQLPAHIQLGPVEFSAITISIGIENRKIPIGLASDIKASLGPLQAVVQQVGIEANLEFPADSNGQLGPVAFSLDFKPPTGVGLSIDAGVVRGGGFLFIDVDRGEYAGALELMFSEVVALTAIGIITTKMPDGSSGFSLLIIITAEFGSGIQLGFGFTLLGVGGLIGLNRTMRLQPLMEGVRTGAIESVMFPQDVVANAPKIISDLRNLFPPQEGTFLIGPMAKLGWGTPTLVSISLGIIIEIPGNIAILGVLKIAIPADEVALIVLQVNFAGAIEFDKKRLYFFAALFESRIIFLTIEGEMGLLVAFGDDANFVVSVGGFHPRFTPPPLPFPSPRRIAISLLNTPYARVRIEGYFAVTSNTVQFGAGVEVFFGLDEINVQGHLRFDALFQFSPFLFIIEISASFSVTVFGIGLFSVSVRGTLDGPSPYHIRGTGSLSLLFFDIDVDFEETWGESRNTEMPPIAVMPIFDSEINKAENWRALLPAASNLLVSLRKMSTDESALILHPVGVLRISQRALPLELKLDKVGTQKPSDANRLSIVVVGAGLAKKTDTFEQFAPAQFQNFADSDKLSRPAFAPEKSGLELSAAGATNRSSKMVKRIVRYEEIIIDSNFKRFQRRFANYFGALFSHFLAGNAVSRSALSQSTKSQFQPFAEKIDVATETYTVAFQSNNKAFATDSVSFHSEASARDYMNRKVAGNASLAEEIHVIPSFERAA